jgi:dihydrofolate synthase/folylpolyglutamate synthase
VIGPQPWEAETVLERRAAEVGAPLRRIGREWRVEPDAGGFRYVGEATHDLPLPALPGRHQIDNAGLAIAATECLTGFAIRPEHLRQGLLRVEWPARLQRLHRGPLLDMLPSGSELHLDGGHNESGGAALAEWAAATAERGPLDVVIAMRSTKAADAFLARLAPHVRRLRSLSFPEPAWLPAETIAALARSAGIADAKAVRDATTAVRELAGPGSEAKRVLLCGSLYFAGRILTENG